MNAHIPITPQGWQDIATDPKDGTWFIAAQNGELYPCEWQTEEADEGPPSVGWFDLFNQSFEAPTHWIPLPPAPGESA